MVFETNEAAITITFAQIRPLFGQNVSVNIYLQSDLLLYARGSRVMGGVTE